MKFLTLFLFVLLSSSKGYSQWTSAQKSLYIEIYTKALSQMDMGDNEKKVLVNCFLTKFMERYPKFDQVSKIPKDSIFLINKRIGSECAKENANSLKTLVISWDNVTLDKIREITDNIKEFKLLKPEFRVKLVQIMFAELKIIYPKGLPANIPDDKLEIVATKSVERLLNEIQ